MTSVRCTVMTYLALSHDWYTLDLIPLYPITRFPFASGNILIHESSFDTSVIAKPITCRLITIQTIHIQITISHVCSLSF